jgi:hypothetical protein
LVLLPHTSPQNELLVRNALAELLQRFLLLWAVCVTCLLAEWYGWLQYEAWHWIVNLRKCFAQSYTEFNILSLFRFWHLYVPSWENKKIYQTKHALERFACCVHWLSVHTKQIADRDLPTCVCMLKVVFYLFVYSLIHTECCRY